MADRARKRRPSAPRGTPLARHLKWRKLRAGAMAAAVIAVVAGLATIDRLGYLLDHRDDWRRYHDRMFDVVRVIDGDTLIIRARDGQEPTTRVRLWGIDTPEIAKPDLGLPAEPLADEATAFARRLCEGRRVRLALQRHRLRGVYGRLLAYVHVPDGSMLNADLVKAGLARSDDRFDHDQVEVFLDLARHARQRKVGLWRDDK